MASIEQLSTALRNADAAGDVAAAQKLAQAIRQMQAEQSDIGSFLQQQEARYGKYRGQDEEAGFLENVASGFGAGAVGMGEMTSLGAASLLEEEDELAAREKIKAVADYLRPEGGDPDSITYKLASGLGSIAGLAAPAAAAAYAAPAAATTAVGLGVAGALGIGAGAGEASERARAAGATEEERNAATLRGAAIGSLDALPLGRIIRIPGVTEFVEKLGGEATGLIGRLRSAAVSGSMEGVQEATSAILQNLNERGYNPERELVDAGVVEEGAIGAGSGAILQGMVDLFVRGKSRGRTATEGSEVAKEPETVEFDAPTLREGEVQGDLFGAPIDLAEPVDTTASPLGEFADEQINAAVDSLQAKGVDPKTITEEMVVNEINETPKPVEEPSPQRDMIDEAETKQIEEMYDAEETAEIEEMIRAEDEAVAELKRAKGELKQASEAETVQAQEQQVQMDERMAPRESVLNDVLSDVTTGSYVNLERKFSKELSNRNIASGRRAVPTKRERERIKRAADAFAGTRPQEEVKVQEAPTPIESAPEDTQLAELEARIPERKKAEQPPSQLSFAGMGKRKGARAEELTQEQPTPQPVTAEFMDSLGIAPKAPIRKRVEGKDFNAPEVRQEFTTFAQNEKVAQTTRFNIGRALKGTPDEQMDLFAPKGAKNGQPRTTQPTAGGVSPAPTQQDTGRGQAKAPRKQDTEVAETPRPVRLDDTGRGTGTTDAGTRGEQLTLDLPKVAEAPAAVTEAAKPRKPAKKEAPAKAVPTKPKRRTKTVAEEKATDRTETIRKAAEKVQAEGKPTKPEPKKAEPKKAEKKDETTKKLEERFEQLPDDVRTQSASISTDFSESMPKDTLTADDNLKVLELLTNGARARDKVGKDVVTYLGKMKRPMDGLYMAIFDVANQNKRFRKTDDMTDAEFAFFSGMGGEHAHNVLKWAEANLSPEANTWIAETLEKETLEYKAMQKYFKKGGKDIVADLRDREAALQKKEAEEQAQIEKEMREDLGASLASLSEIFTDDYYLKDANALDLPTHPAIRASLRDGNLSQALSRIAALHPNNRISTIAKKLGDVAGKTKVVVSKNLKDSRGNPVAGLFDPETNTIKLDAENGVNIHTTLHEMTHAAVSATLANKGHPVTRQLNKLFNEVKDKLGTAYGATNLDEFVSEAFSNSAFQQELASIYPDNTEVSAFKRFVNSVGNFLRRMLGLNTKPVDSALDSADQLIDSILAPAPDSRGAAELRMSSTRDGVREVAKGIGEAQRELGGATKKFRQDFANNGKQFMEGTVKETAKKVFLRTAPLQALGDVAKAVGLKDIGLRLHETVELQRGAMYESDEWVQARVREVERWANKAGAEQKAILDDVIYSRDYGATIWQVDPTLTRVQAKKKYKDEQLGAWDKQQKVWNTLDPEGKRMYKLMRDTYKEQYNKLKDVIYGRIDEQMKDNPEAAEKLKKEVYSRMFETGTLDVYFPLIREGRYKLEFAYKDSSVANERDAYVVQMFDNIGERDMAIAELRKDDNVVPSSIKKHDGDYGMDQYRAAPPTSFVGETLQTLKANGVSEDVQAEILRLFIEALPENSFAKSLQRREGTAGHLTDSLYAMKTKAYDLGRQTERLRYGAKIQQIEDEIKEQVAMVEAEDKKTAVPVGMVGAELMDRARFARAGAKNKQQEKVYKGMNQVAFVYTIGFNTASALVNLSQVPLFVMPMLGGKYGWGNTTRELHKAMGLVTGSKLGADSVHTVGKVLDKASLAYGIDAYYSIDDNGDFNVRTDLELSNDMVAELERLAPLVKMATDRGQLNRSFLLDALGLEEGGRVQRGNVFTRNMDKVSGISAMLFNQAERFNRQVTLIASYNLALEDIKAKNPELSTRELQERAAREALYETQQTNGGAVLETAPGYAQEGIGRVALMYKSYGIQMYYTMLKTAKQMVDAHIEGDKETRNQAFKQILGFHGTALFFSGVYGVPLYGAVQLLADTMFLDDDEDDFNTIVRKQIGEGWYKGPLNQLLDVDVASRVRLSGLLVQENRYNNGASLEENIMFYLGGPALSVGKRFLRGAEDLSNGEIDRGIESLLPAGVANAYKTAFGRYQKEGGIYTRRGDPIYDDLSTSEMMAQFLGFAPAEYTFRQEVNQRDKKIEGAVLQQRSDLMRKYYVARRRGDFEEVRRIRDKMREFGQKHRDARITAESIEKSMQSHRETSREMYNGVTINPLMRRAIEESRAEYDQGFKALSSVFD